MRSSAARISPSARHKPGLGAELVKFTAGPPQFAACRSESIDAGLFGTAGYVGW